MNKDFYIGYMPKAPKGIARFVFGIVLLLFLSMGGVSYYMSTSHQFINNGTYEFGELTELTGVIRSEPVPYIRITADEEGKVGKNIMLIDFGKFGARESVEKIKSKVGGNLNNVEVTIRGTLIYQDGFTLLELTEKENALLRHKPLEDPAKYISQPTAMQNKRLTGEIVDPKCYFGSMKPGQGKPHRSCANLCIAGGIPPVFVVETPEKTAEYYILKGMDGRDINQEILDYVAYTTEIQGMVTSLNEWNVLYIEPEKIKRLD